MFQFARGGRNPVGDKKLLLLVEFRGPKSYRRAVQVSEEALPAWHGANRASFRARAPRVAGSLYRQKNGDSSESNRRWYLKGSTDSSFESMVVIFRDIARISRKLQL